ncbi:hypothetical protein [Paenibacillus sp. DMB5]|uniref:hypothetical protein n=1 Tax=Paenibacillus sp. DMB5 TaxID=1780103 RepID=UPI00076DA4D9|nr:hypothetical protein [Paenibacillus sp. DMB5]KUP25807.1 hypothetical protein AWJ19_19480 [Paenibacillus sp. DMB5]
MNSIHDINDLLTEMYDEIDKGFNIDITLDKHERYKNYHEYLTNLKKKVDKDKLKFVFIGEKGRGKTTTIINLFGLLMDDKELLATGSGGTTVCEVELLESKDQHSFIEIVPIEDKYMEQYVYDFCSTFKRDDKNNETYYVPTEIARSIRNMLKLNTIKLKELYVEMNNFDLFHDEITKRLRLNEREEFIVQCQSDEFGSYFEDIQKKFNLINLGKLDYIKIPQKIILHLTKDVLDFSLFKDIKTVVDTRGIDSSLGKEKDETKEKDSYRREDILAYIDKQQEECLFLFIDGIKPAPSTDILETISTRITKENADRFYLLVNVQHDEAEKVMTDDGPAGTVELGVEYKRDDIISKFEQENIPFKESNILFYNSKLNYPSPSDILNAISQNIKSTKNEIFSLSDGVQTAFYKLKYDQENNERALEYYEELIEEVGNIVPNKNLADEIINDFIGERMRSVHSSRLNAINRVNGDYVFFNFYHHFSLAIERAFDRIYLEAKNDVAKKVNGFLKYRNINKLEEIDYKAFLDKFQRDYLEQRREVTSRYKDLLLKSFRNTSWASARNEYGRGTGAYTSNVCDIYKIEILNLNVLHPFRDTFIDSWTSIIAGNNLIK